MTAIETAGDGPFRVPPMPKGVPLLGNLLDIGADPFGAFERWRDAHGDIVALQMGSWPALLLNGSDLIEQVLVKQHENFTKHRFFWRHITLLMGNGLFTSEGTFWQRQRRLAAPAFSTQRLQTYDAVMVERTEAMMARWQDSAVIDLHPEMMALGLRIAAKTMFDAEVKEDVDAIEEAMNWIIEEIKSRFARPFVIPDAIPLPGHLRYRKAIGFIERIVDRIIAERRERGIDKGDLISMLIKAQDEDGSQMTDRQLRDEVLTMLLAGYETSALTMCWTYYLLGQSPEWQDRIADEVRAVAGDRPLTYADLERLKATENVIIESMRLYPPAWAIGREAKADCRIGDYQVKAGTTVYMSSWVTQRDPRNFDAPLAFRPERWTPELRRALPRFAYFPFGGGPRICIGNRFAMMEAMLLTATIARRYRIEQASDKPVLPFPSITLRPKGGILGRLQRRAG
jgi:cytochrome P450